MELDHNCLNGKVCHILINLNNKSLSYRARIIYTGLYHISFIDKFKKIYSFNLANVIEIQVLEEGLYEEDKYEKVKTKGGEKDVIW